MILGLAKILETILGNFTVVFVKSHGRGKTQMPPPGRGKNSEKFSPRWLRDVNWLFDA
jgi:hypothetical protein